MIQNNGGCKIVIDKPDTRTDNHEDVYNTGGGRTQM